MVVAFRVEFASLRPREIPAKGGEEQGADESRRTP